MGGVNILAFAGDIDDIRMLTEALTAEQIAILYDEPLESIYPEQNGIVLDSSLNLSWSESDDAQYYDVYVDTNYVNVANATISNNTTMYYLRTGDTSVNSDISLLSSENVYWRVDKVVDGQMVWGDIWRFKFEYCDLQMVPVVESYDNYDSALLCVHWTLSGSELSWYEFESIKTYDYTTGSMVVHYETKESPFFTELTNDFCVAQNWLVDDLQSLELHFYGYQDNIAQQLYFKVKDTASNAATVIYPDAEDMVQSEQDWLWRQWNIDLEMLSSQGVDLSNVASISIGLQRPDGDSEGGQGSIIIDQIELKPSMCLSSMTGEADVNKDCSADIYDLILLAEAWLDSSAGHLIAEEPSDENLIAYYPFDESEGLTSEDISGNQHHATVYSSDTIEIWSSDGVADNCIVFNGEYQSCPIVSIPESVFGIVNDELTISFWMYVDNSCSNIFTVFDNYPADTGVADTNQLTLTLGTVVIPMFELENSNKSQWNHYAMTMSSAEGMIKYYFNGELLVFRNSNLSLDFSGLQYFILGRSFPSNNSSVYGAGAFSGKLDELKFYNKMLSQQEILALAGKDAFFQKVNLNANINNDSEINIEDYSYLSTFWKEIYLWPR